MYLVLQKMHCTGILTNDIWEHSNIVSTNEKFK